MITKVLVYRQKTMMPSKLLCSQENTAFVNTGVCCIGEEVCASLQPLAPFSRNGPREPPGSSTIEHFSGFLARKVQR